MKSENHKINYYECDCGSMKHLLRVSYFTDDPDFLYIEVFLNDVGFFRRLVRGMKYIFGFKSKYGAFDEFIWSPETAREYRKIIDQYLEPNKKFDEK